MRYIFRYAILYSVHPPDLFNVLIIQLMFWSDVLHLSFFCYLELRSYLDVFFSDLIMALLHVHAFKSDIMYMLTRNEYDGTFPSMLSVMMLHGADMVKIIFIYLSS